MSSKEVLSSYRDNTQEIKRIKEDDRYPPELREALLRQLTIRYKQDNNPHYIELLLELNRTIDDKNNNDPDR